MVKAASIRAATLSRNVRGSPRGHPSGVRLVRAPPDAGLNAVLALYSAQGQYVGGRRCGTEGGYHVNDACHVSGNEDATRQYAQWTTPQFHSTVTPRGSRAAPRPKSRAEQAGVASYGPALRMAADAG